MNFIEKANINLKLEEGSLVIEHLLIECYLKPGISTKELARKVFLPVPITVAIKKELIKAGALVQKAGVRITSEGKKWIEQDMGYSGLDVSLYRKLLADESNWGLELQDILDTLNHLFALRPQVDVQIDQSQCTAETSLRRAILCLKEHCLIGKQILCVGDDDLVSISIGLLLKRLFPNKHRFQTRIDVMDIDSRFLDFIKESAVKENLPIECIYHDMRQPLKEPYLEKYDCFFTDPPYTLSGMNLFIARGVSALKKQKGLTIFLSFAHKSPGFTLEIHRSLVQMGISVSTIIPNFNTYEGAQMIANRSQMLIMKTTDHSNVSSYMPETFGEPIYTGEVKRSVRVYSCKNCGETIKVGFQCKLKSIEQLKNEKCPCCSKDTFKLIKKFVVEKESRGRI